MAIELIHALQLLQFFSSFSPSTDIFKTKTPVGTFLTGSEHNDPFYLDENGRIRTVTNRSGGIQVLSRPI